MPPASFEFNRVRVSFDGGGLRPERAERIARLTFGYVRELLATTAARGTPGGRTVERLEVRPVRVSFGAMDDESIARASALEIQRAVLRALAD